MAGIVTLPLLRRDTIRISAHWIFRPPASSHCPDLAHLVEVFDPMASIQSNGFGIGAVREDGQLQEDQDRWPDPLA